MFEEGNLEREGTGFCPSQRSTWQGQIYKSRLLNSRGDNQPLDSSPKLCCPQNLGPRQAARPCYVGGHCQFEFERVLIVRCFGWAAWRRHASAAAVAFILCVIQVSQSLPQGVPQALQWPDFCSDLKNSTHLSDSALKELTRREIEAREMFCDMARLLTKIDCDQPYSVNQNQSLQCQRAYRDWACSMIAESIEVESGNDGKNIPSRSLIPSCDSICHRVLRVCPYLTPDRYQLKSINNNSVVLALHPSQYGGHPAFYCPTRSGLKFSALASRSNGGSVSHQYFYRNASEVNLTDELINSNDTYCCWTYSEALKTEYVSLNEDEPSVESGKNPFHQYDDDSPNQVLIQCLHAPSDTAGKEGQDPDGTSRDSDFDKVASGGGGASSMVVADQSDPQPSTLALSRAIKAADMEVTEGDAGLLSGDSSEANYYLRDDWFDVSPRSKSIQKRNNYNFLNLVSSSSKQHEQQSSSSVLSSGEEDDSEGLYGGPMIDDDNENVGLLEGDHHQSELEIGKNRKETRHSRQEAAAILDEEFISTSHHGRPDSFTGTSKTTAPSASSSPKLIQ
ncbi:unnamed protein product [Allacma fusca]|uniref:FZ domain-containing protein n=1 Tax=Allacma fusca TaxID=39272 RepID=A0A8J2JL59_9HEXA|nr:unnamed protein product [Allacma fusca]